ncbi:MAG: ABC transporter permease [Rhodothermales bacterium]
MLRNYWTTAWRNLRKRAGFAAINVFGLAVGLACCLLIGLYIVDEMSYDRFHEEGERIYRMKHTWSGIDETPSPDHFNVWGSAAPGPLLKEEFPEVEHVVRLSGKHRFLLQHEDRVFQEESYLFADSAFFEVFSFELLRGDPTQVLAQPDGIVLTETAAQRYFGDEDPIGQPMTLANDVELTVVGLMADVPSQSHMQFDMLISMLTIEQRWPEFRFTNWGYIDFFTYVQLRPDADLASFQAQMPAFVDRHYGEALRTQNPPQNVHLRFEPIYEAYLAPTMGRTLGPQGNTNNLYIFGCIGLFVLLIAGINFTNLSTARAVERAREVGVRKVVGAHRPALIRQFLAEAALLALTAMALALVIAEVSLPAFQNLTGKAIQDSVLLDPGVIGMMLVVTLLVGGMAGAYPALVLSAYRPVQVLKGSFQTSSKGQRLRQGLVIVQFAISIGLIAATLIVFQQLGYLQSQPLGFEDEQQIVLDFGGDSIVQEQRNAILEAFEANPRITAASATRSVPGGYNPGAGTDVEVPSGGMDNLGTNLYEVDFGYMEQLGLETVAGRHFNPDFAMDSTQALIVNEAAARYFGYANPADVVGKRFSQWGRDGEIIGVVKDFHFQSLHSTVRPLSFRIAPNNTGMFLLTVNTENMPETLGTIEQIWREMIPHRPFLYDFLDESFAQLYNGEQQFGRLFGIFAGLAIFIACLGLFGLATFTAQQRTKEVGVRKVLGATVPELIRLLSVDFLKLVGIAFAVAAPLAYFGMREWLNGFAYQVPLGVGVFVLAGVLALLIALGTVAYQAIRAATVNPVEALRYE